MRSNRFISFDRNNFLVHCLSTCRLTAFTSHQIHFRFLKRTLCAFRKIYWDLIDGVPSSSVSIERHICERTNCPWLPHMLDEMLWPDLCVFALTWHLGRFADVPSHTHTRPHTSVQYETNGALACIFMCIMQHVASANTPNAIVQRLVHTAHNTNT